MTFFIINCNMKCVSSLNTVDRFMIVHAINRIEVYFHRKSPWIISLQKYNNTNGKFNM